MSAYDCKLTILVLIIRALATPRGSDWKRRKNKTVRQLTPHPIAVAHSQSQAAWYRDSMYIPLGGNRVSPLRL